MRLLDQRVLVEKPDLQNSRVSGLVLSEEAAKDILETVVSVVVAVGPGPIAMSGLTVDMGIRVGDRVLFSPRVMSELQINGVTYGLIRADNVIAILEGDEK